MPKTLAEQRAEKRVRRPRFSQEMCLAQDLIAEVQQLTHKRFALVGANPDDRPDGQRRKQRVNDPVLIEANNILARLGELGDEMADYTGELVWQGIDLGEWMRWCEANPARGEGEPGYDIDLRVTGGVCDAQALADDLRRYAHTWNGDPITDDDWDHIVANAGSGDWADAARGIVNMHERGSDLPKLRAALQGIPEPGIG